MAKRGLSMGSLLVLSLALAMAASANTAPACAPYAGWTDAHLYTADGSMHYWQAGDGRPVILIHGNMASGRWFTALAPPLGYKFYAPDLPGFGMSPGKGEFSLEAYADAGLAFMDAVNADEVSLLIGHSLGGLVAARMAAMLPEAFGALMLTNVPYLGNSPIPADYYTKAARYVQEDELLLESLIRAALTLPAGWALEMMFDEARRMDPAGFTENPRILETAGMHLRLKDYGGRVVFIGCALDEVIPASIVRFNSMMTPESEYIEISLSGHAPMLEVPQEFTSIIESLLEGDPR